MIGNPHAIGLVSGGILGGSTIGITSSGYLVKIFEYTYVPPVDSVRSTGPGMRGFRSKEKDKFKTVIITVEAYGKTVVTSHIVEKDIKVGIEDVIVKEREGGKITVEIKNTP